MCLFGYATTHALMEMRVKSCDVFLVEACVAVKQNNCILEIYWIKVSTDMVREEQNENKEKRKQTKHINHTNGQIQKPQNLNFKRLENITPRTPNKEPQEIKNDATNTHY